MYRCADAHAIVVSSSIRSIIICIMSTAARGSAAALDSGRGSRLYNLDVNMNISKASAGHGDHHGHSPSGTSGQEAQHIDPVCGMKVIADPQKRVVHKGTAYYFCSQRCMTRFSEDPGHFLATAHSVPSSNVPHVQVTATIYTCPMHPEIRQDHPGNCPKCGMALEPEMPALEEEENPELRAFARRFWWTLPLTVAVFVLAMFGHRLQWMDMRVQSWVELLLALPIVLWAGFPFFDRGWRSVLNRSPNMWTLIGLGTGAAFIYSV